MKLVGISGRKRSGKGTAAKVIERLARPARTIDVGFADKLKLAAIIALGYDPRNLQEALSLADIIKTNDNITVGAYLNGLPLIVGKLTPLGLWASTTDSAAIQCSGREYYQRFGTEVGRDLFGEDFWVDQLLPHEAADLPYKFQGADVVCITDLRFPNEAQRVLDLGGMVWEINADKRIGVPNDPHPSEQPLPRDLVTMTIPNNTTEEQFEVAVRAAWRLSC